MFNKTFCLIFFIDNLFLELTKIFTVLARQDTSNIFTVMSLFHMKNSYVPLSRDKIVVCFYKYIGHSQSYSSY